MRQTEAIWRGDIEKSAKLTRSDSIIGMRVFETLQKLSYLILLSNSYLLFSNQNKWHNDPFKSYMPIAD